MTTLHEAEENARSIVNIWTGGAAAVSWVPGSTLVLGTADWAMINKVANAFGVKEYNKEAVVATVAACTGGKWAAEALSFIPVAGWAVKAVIASGMTKALGEAVIRYFRNCSPYK